MNKHWRRYETIGEITPGDVVSMDDHAAFGSAIITRIADGELTGDTLVSVERPHMSLSAIGMIHTPMMMVERYTVSARSLKAHFMVATTGPSGDADNRRR